MVDIKTDHETRLIHERLCRLFDYDISTGVFTRKVGIQGGRKGRPAGHVEPNGYRRIMIDGLKFLAHRLAWFYVNKKWPVGTIDHRDLCPDNNWYSNLREATHSQNHANTRPLKSKSGLKGAHWNATRNHWQSYIKINGKSIRLGRFETPQDAHAAYVKAASQYQGEFARAK